MKRTALVWVTFACFMSAIMFTTAPALAAAPEKAIGGTSCEQKRWECLASKIVKLPRCTEPILSSPGDFDNWHSDWYEYKACIHRNLELEESAANYCNWQYLMCRLSAIRDRVSRQ